MPWYSVGQTTNSKILRANRTTNEVAIIFKRPYHDLAVKFILWNSVFFCLDYRND